MDKFLKVLNIVALICCFMMTIMVYNVYTKVVKLEYEVENSMVMVRDMTNAFIEYIKVNNDIKAKISEIKTKHIINKSKTLLDMAKEVFPEKEEASL